MRLPKNALSPTNRAGIRDHPRSPAQINPNNRAQDPREEKCYDPRSCPPPGVAGAKKSVMAARRATGWRRKVLRRHGAQLGGEEKCYGGTARKSLKSRALNKPSPPPFSPSSSSRASSRTSGGRAVTVDLRKGALYSGLVRPRRVLFTPVSLGPTGCRSARTGRLGCRDRSPA
jgi:hypothetical protein